MSRAVLGAYYARFHVCAQLSSLAILVAMASTAVLSPARSVFAADSEVQGQ
jgi:hypothetical protein